MYIFKCEVFFPLKWLLMLYSVPVFDLSLKTSSTHVQKFFYNEKKG